MRVACFSVAVMDYLLRMDEYYPGGNAVNQAVWFRSRGHETAFLGALGTDRDGDRIRALLADTGIDTSHSRRIEGLTARNALDHDENGERLFIEGGWNGGVVQEFRLSDQDWSYLHSFEVWATHTGTPDLEAVMERKDKPFLVVDFLDRPDLDRVERCADRIDITFMGGNPDMIGDVAAIAARTASLIVLTLGAEGSVAFDGEQRFEQEALPVNYVLDTTGCGDAFQAAFTAHYYEYRDVSDALLAGAEAGQYATRYRGGVLPVWNLV